MCRCSGLHGRGWRGRALVSRAGRSSPRPLAHRGAEAAIDARRRRDQDANRRAHLLRLFRSGPEHLCPGMAAGRQCRPLDGIRESMLDRRDGDSSVLPTAARVLARDRRGAQAGRPARPIVDRAPTVQTLVALLRAPGIISVCAAVYQNYIQTSTWTRCSATSRATSTSVPAATLIETYFQVKLRVA